MIVANFSGVAKLGGVANLNSAAKFSDVTNLDGVSELADAAIEGNTWGDAAREDIAELVATVAAFDGINPLNEVGEVALADALVSEADLGKLDIISRLVPSSSEDALAPETGSGSLGTPGSSLVLHLCYYSNLNNADAVNSADVVDSYSNADSADAMDGADNINNADADAAISTGQFLLPDQQRQTVAVLHHGESCTAPVVRHEEWKFASVGMGSVLHQAPESGYGAQESGYGAQESDSRLRERDFPVSEEVLYNANATSSSVSPIKLTGYLQYNPRFDTALLAVHPKYRRRGIATELLFQARQRLGKLPSVWSFGHFAPGAALAQKLGYRSCRELLEMENVAATKNAAVAENNAVSGNVVAGNKAVSGNAIAVGNNAVSGNAVDARNVAATGNVAVPVNVTASETRHPTPEILPTSRMRKSHPTKAGSLQIRAFTMADISELIAVNKAAFADHLEQGQMTRADFERLMAEPWFDAAGLLLGFDSEGLVGFHWTKIAEPAIAESAIGEPTTAKFAVGEVYVLGVHPRAQGMGYGRLLLNAGLEHLARSGVETVILFVDAGDGKAVKLYEAAGFKLRRSDVLYIRQE